ncbi:unnamed protein product [Heterobilharzia americana]|nr:unnamed protein product [Heterobilharzia americana]
MLEAFLSSSFHDHLRCTSEFFLRASTIHHQISQALSTGPSQLSLLDKKMDEDINSICKLLHLKPDK